MIRTGRAAFLPRMHLWSLHGRGNNLALTWCLVWRALRAVRVQKSISGTLNYQNYYLRDFLNLLTQLWCKRPSSSVKGGLMRSHSGENKKMICVFLHFKYSTSVKRKGFKLEVLFTTFYSLTQPVELLHGAAVTLLALGLCILLQGCHRERLL